MHIVTFEAAFMTCCVIFMPLISGYEVDTGILVGNAIKFIILAFLITSMEQSGFTLLLHLIFIRMICTASLNLNERTIENFPSKGILA